MDRHENYNSERARSLGIAQIVFVVLVLILGIVQASLTAGVFIIAPIIYSVFQIAPITCTMISSQNKGKCIIMASMILNILTAIFGSFSHICYSIAWTAISSSYWNFYNSFGDPSDVEYFGWTKNVKTFTIISICMIILALAMFVVNIWSAVLGYVSCESSTRPQYIGAQGGHVVVMQSSAYSQQGYMPQGYVHQGNNHGFIQQGAPTHNYPSQGYAQQAVLAPGYPPQGMPPQGMPPQATSQQTNPDQGLPQAAQKS